METIEELFKKYYKRLVWYSYNIVLSEMTAEDIVSQVFLNNWNYLITLEVPKTFLFIAVRNMSLNYNASIIRHEKSHEEMWYMSGEEDIEVDVIRVEALAYIYDNIDKLPLQRKAVIKYIIAGKTVKWISKRLHISTQTVLNHKSIAINELKKSLKSTTCG